MCISCGKFRCHYNSTVICFIILGRLDCGKLSITVSTTLQKICREWNNSNSPLPAMAPPGAKYIVSVHAIKNSRRKMEDRHECCVNVNQIFGLEVQCGYLA